MGIGITPQGLPMADVVDIHDLCVHCGSARWVPYHAEPIYYVVCNDCGARGPVANTREESIKRWQQRDEKGRGKMTAERAALQANYDAAVEAMADDIYRDIRDAYDSTMSVDREKCREQAKKIIAAKLANAADEGKRGKA